MYQFIECIIAGGPEHGLIRRRLWDPRYALPPAMSTQDGQLCNVAASRTAGRSGRCFLLLHPLASGREFIDMLAVLNEHAASDSAPAAH
ncbi:hypothetical protein [Dyella agri]|uniref:Uncharacterized protein n=1 Tax=Dyella agri TaxID=1926869 RepID=A0ABW8KI64_9GAMM